MPMVLGKRQRTYTPWEAVKSKWSGSTPQRKYFKKFITNYKKKIQRPLKTSEIKNFDVTLATTAITTAGIIVDSTLNLVRLGTDDNNRVGRKISIISIHLRGSLHMPSQTVLSSMNALYRVILYLDTQCNGATAAVADILATADEKSFLNLDNTDRFIILKDWFFKLGTETNTVLAGPVYASTLMQKVLTFNKKCDFSIKFDADAGAITDITSNNIGIMAIASTANNAFLDMTSRIRFSDN